MKNENKINKGVLVIVTLVLFTITTYLAFVQGGVNITDKIEATQIVESVDSALIISAPLHGKIVSVFAATLNGFMKITGHNMILAIILLALFVELILLYPSVRLQIKQKKIHIFHKKLVDRFDSGELSVSETKDELHKLYAVNEKIHRKGFIYAGIQIIIFLAVLWGFRLLVKAPELLEGSWNISLLSQPENFFIPLAVSLLYILHALVKIYFKEKEDHISAQQTIVALVIAILLSAVVYLFSSIFAVLLTLYFVTQITFATVRYIIVEQHSQAWGKYVQVELIHMLRHAEIHKHRFQYLTRRLIHLPVVRHLNFHLLEEAFSMSLGLVIALNFFGGFGGDSVPTASAAGDPRSCTQVADNRCNYVLFDSSVDFNTLYYQSDSNKFITLTGQSQEPITDLFPRSCCLSSGEQIVLDANVKNDNDNNPGCYIPPVETCSDLKNLYDCPIYECTWNSTSSRYGDFCKGGERTKYICAYLSGEDDIFDIEMDFNGSRQGCPTEPFNIGDAVNISATYGSGYFRWEETNSGDDIDSYCVGDTEKCNLVSYTFDSSGTFTFRVEDYYNSLNSTTCDVEVVEPNIVDTSNLRECNPTSIHVCSYNSISDIDDVDILSFSELYSSLNSNNIRDTFEKLTYQENNDILAMGGFPDSCCISGLDQNNQSINYQVVLDANIIQLNANEPGCFRFYGESCEDINTEEICNKLSCSYDYSSGACTGEYRSIYRCRYRSDINKIPDIEIGGCPSSSESLNIGDTVNLDATGGSGYFRWKSEEMDVNSCAIDEGCNNSFQHTFDSPGSFNIAVEDYYNNMNSATCLVEVLLPTIEFTNSCPATVEIGTETTLNVSSGSGEYDLTINGDPYGMFDIINTSINGDTITFTPYETGTYTFQVTDSQDPTINASCEFTVIESAIDYANLRECDLVGNTCNYTSIPINFFDIIDGFHSKELYSFLNPDNNIRSGFMMMTEENDETLALNEFPKSCCIDVPDQSNYQVILDTNTIVPTGNDLEPGCFKLFGGLCEDFDTERRCNAYDCNYSSGACDGGYRSVYICNYQSTISDVGMSGECPSELNIDGTVNLGAMGGSGYFRWKINGVEIGSCNGDNETCNPFPNHTFDSEGEFTVTVEDYYNGFNFTSCVIEVADSCSDPTYDQYCSGNQLRESNDCGEDRAVIDCPYGCDSNADECNSCSDTTYDRYCLGDQVRESNSCGEDREVENCQHGCNSSTNECNSALIEDIEPITPGEISLGASD